MGSFPNFVYQRRGFDCPRFCFMHWSSPPDGTMPASVMIAFNFGSTAATSFHSEALMVCSPRACPVNLQQAGRKRAAWQRILKAIATSFCPSGCSPDQKSLCLMHRVLIWRSWLPTLSACITASVGRCRRSPNVPKANALWKPCIKPDLRRRPVTLTHGLAGAGPIFFGNWSAVTAGGHWHTLRRCCAWPTAVDRNKKSKHEFDTLAHRLDRKQPTRFLGCARLSSH